MSTQVRQHLSIIDIIFPPKAMRDTPPALGTMPEGDIVRWRVGSIVVEQTRRVRLSLGNDALIWLQSFTDADPPSSATRRPLPPGRGGVRGACRNATTSPRIGSGIVNGTIPHSFIGVRRKQPLRTFRQRLFIP